MSALVINVLLAAVEPAAKTLALLFKHLIDHPGQLAQARRETALLSAAIAETLRCTPPVQLVPRQPEKDAVFAGTVVPAGATVFCVIGAVNRDPDAFSAPDTFDIHRPDLGTAHSFTAAAQHLAFGTGLRQCVGAAFARAEIETVAALLLPLLDQVCLSPGFRYRETGLYTRGPIAPPTWRVVFTRPPTWRVVFTKPPAALPCARRPGRPAAPSCGQAPMARGPPPRPGPVPRRARPSGRSMASPTPR